MSHAEAFTPLHPAAGATKAVIGFVSELHHAALSEEVRHYARRHLLDTVGVMIAGAGGAVAGKAEAMLAAVRPLQAAAASGLAVLASAHQRKSHGDFGEAGQYSLTSHSAPDVPSAAVVVNPIQLWSWRIGPVVNARVASEASRLPSASRAVPVTAMVYAVDGWSRVAGAMIARRPSVGLSRTLKGTGGEMLTACCKLGPFMSRVKSTVRYAAGSTPLSPLAGDEPAKAGGPSVTNDQWWRSTAVLPAKSLYPASRTTSYVELGASVGCW